MGAAEVENAAVHEADSNASLRQRDAVVAIAIFALAKLAFHTIVNQRSDSRNSVHTVGRDAPSVYEPGFPPSPSPPFLCRSMTSITALAICSVRWPSSSGSVGRLAGALSTQLVTAFVRSSR